MNTLFSKYFGISMSYGFIHSIYHVCNYKPLDNKPILFIDKSFSILGYTCASIFSFPMYLYEDMRNTEIYLKNLNKNDYQPSWNTLYGYNIK